MNEYFMMGLVIAVAVLAYMYKEEKKKNFILQVELDLLEERSYLDAIKKELTDEVLPPLPAIPSFMLEHVSSGHEALTGGLNSGGNAEAPRTRPILKGL